MAKQIKKYCRVGFHRFEYFYINAIIIFMKCKRCKLETYDFFAGKVTLTKID